MGMILFDTLKLSRTLRDKGHFTSEQAEALAEALGEASQDNLATKADLATATADLKTEIVELRTELKSEIVELRTELKSEIAELRTELRTEIAELRTELRTGLAELRTESGTGLAELRTESRTGLAEVKSDLLRWIIGAIGFQTVAILSAVFAIVRFIR